MSIECYAKVDFNTEGRKSKIPSVIHTIQKISEWPKNPRWWFCHLRLIEHTEVGQTGLMQMLHYIPGFRWHVLEKCADVTWYERIGGNFDWEDVPEVCSFLSQDDEAGYIPILPFSHCVHRELLVKRDEIQLIFPECFTPKPEEPVDELAEDVPDTSMPTPILADYLRDRL